MAWPVKSTMGTVCVLQTWTTMQLVKVGDGARHSMLGILGSFLRSWKLKDEGADTCHARKLQYGCALGLLFEHLAMQGSHA